MGALVFGVTGYAIGDGQTITAWTSLEPENKQTISYQEAKKQLETIRSSPIASASQRATKKPLQSPDSAAFPEVPSSIKTLFDDQQFSCRIWEPDPTKFIIPEQSL